VKIFRFWIGLGRILLPIWLAIYFIGFRGFWVFVFVPLVAVKGIWWSTLIAFLVYGVWGTVFYLLILRGRVFDRAREKLAHLQPQKEYRILTWIKSRLSRYEDLIQVSPLWTLAMFVVGGVLTGVLVIRVVYSQKYWRKALILVWAGCAVEVLTWFLPLYGGLFSLVRVVLANWFRT